MRPEGTINTTMDHEDFFNGAIDPAIITELNSLVSMLAARRLSASSWYGELNPDPKHSRIEKVNRGYGYAPIPASANDAFFPWFLYWQIGWVFTHSEFKPGETVLDLGGASSLFSYFLASNGLRVTSVDANVDLVHNGNHVAKKMGWSLGNAVADIRTMEAHEQYDHVTSICVFEHIPLFDRIKASKLLKHLVRPGGRMAMTFDYVNPSRFASINTPADVHAQFVQPSGMNVRGNESFVDTGTRYLLHPFFASPRLWRYKASCLKRREFGLPEFFKAARENNYTFGALFLQNS